MFYKTLVVCVSADASSNYDLGTIADAGEIYLELYKLWSDLFCFHIFHENLLIENVLELWTSNSVKYTLELHKNPHFALPNFY